MRLKPRRSAEPQGDAPADRPVPGGNRVLVAGWFSWPDCGTTAGDLLARDVACAWLARSGRDYDVANDALFGAGVDWRRVDPGEYSEVLFVCGPMRRDAPSRALFDRFSGSSIIGLDLSMIEPLSDWNPFDTLYERDSDRAARPDLSFASPHDARPVPVLGVVLVEPYPPEYPGRDMQAAARQAALRLAGGRPAARIDIDTRLPANAGGLRSPAEVEALLRKCDAVITTRLHGLVLALKHGVPAVAIDPVAGGAKISRQAGAVGWPAVRSADALDSDDLDRALDYCLTEEARAQARECAARARAALVEMEVEFRRNHGAPPA